MTVDHREREFERSIVAHLVAHGEYVEGNPDNFDSQSALSVKDVIGFVKDSQPKAWERLVTVHQAKSEENFIARLVKELDAHGMLHVLRHGITDYGVHVDMMYSAPQTGLNPEAKALYEKNILTVTRQVNHSVRNPNDAVDLMFFVNGLPVATAELKTEFTGQSYRNAIKQYREDRDPRDPIFQFKKRALVHFAVDTDEAWMSTRLTGRHTVFLPFNKGNDNAAGNPVNADGFRTSYLWEYVLARESWIDILARFMHLQVEKKDGRIVSERIIFPRYHQLDVVRKINQDVRERGAGGSYLIQHSAGSGKSNSIAWLAYRLASLHDTEDKLIFDSVVVVTDRRVLDKQLQDTIYQFEHKAGVVEPIDKHSDQLAKAITSGVKIIITTLQKFPFVTEKIGSLPDRNYAIIVDEAHSSQTGESAREMKTLLGSALDDAEREALEEEEEGRDYEEELIKTMKARGRHENLSFFAFTATPKFKTLEMFGNMGADGKPHPFHLYSMRQAIEEKFILDVLMNYTTYKTYFRIAKKIEEDPDLDKRKAVRALMKYISQHPHNIAEKTKVMVEHFYHNTRKLLDGRAKAMVVTASRLHAVKYYHAFREYIKERGYDDEIKILAAFSGKVLDGGLEYTEYNLNGFSDNEIPEQFSRDYNILVVAYKFQTGFDQPLLHTMYVDQRLKGVKAVQTLSRLNRTAPGKEDTFILDFANDADTIKEAFEPYYVTTSIDEPTDPNILYDLRTALEKFQVYWPQEVENFAKVFFTVKEKHTAKDQGLLHSYVDPGVERFKALGDDDRDLFKTTLLGFLKLYSYAANIMPFSDPELEKLYAFGRFLYKKLPRRERGGSLYIEDDVALEYYRLMKVRESKAIYLTGTEAELGTEIKVGSGASAEDEKVRLSELINDINELFGDIDFRDGDKLFFDQIAEDLSTSEKIKAQAKNNTRENFKFGVSDAVMDAVISRMSKNEKIAKAFLDNENFRNYILDQIIVRDLYRRLNVEAG
jgi:type I restriction enzyme R subunit